MKYALGSRRRNTLRVRVSVRVSVRSRVRVRARVRVSTLLLPPWLGSRRRLVHSSYPLGTL